MAVYNEYVPKKKIYRIWKYEIKFEGEQTIKIPGFNKILSVQFQGNKLFAWVIIEPEGKPVNVKFYIAGTGLELPKDISMCTHVDTVLDGPLVWHIFYREIA